MTRPDAWPVIPGTGGARKARVALPGRGKSAGVRVIYFVLVAADALYLLNISAKSEKENLTDAEKNAARRLIAEIEAEAHSARPAADRGP
ncbi:MAG: type II toxin-antitoxin system RelE/ParE family toxin [Acetobacteraceae bacterium]